MLQLVQQASAPGAWGDLAAFGRLDQASRAPVAVAVSGGGDSLAALIHTCAWAKRHGRPVMALSVDHRLQAASAGWTAFAGEQAARLGARFEPLAWTGSKPKTGIPAAARAARHALLADAARAAGCTVLITGHTADDAAENAALGQGALREWRPSPAWPQGRNLFLLRPLLGLRRAGIRAQLAASGFSWIDDPANDDPSHPRIQVRAAGPALVAPPPPSPGPEPLDGEGLRFRREDLDAAALAVAAVCAGGGDHLPGSGQVQRLVRRIAAGENFAATLCSARIEAGQVVSFERETGRSPPPTLALPPGRAVVWDGRYELIANRPGLTVGPLAGHAATLSKAELAGLRRMEAWARPSLPLVRGIDQSPFCPVFAGDNGVRARWLVTGRYRAACDLLANERAACDETCMANGVSASYVWA